MKDRFRVCCPDEGQRHRKGKRRGAYPHHLPEKSSQASQACNNAKIVDLNRSSADVVVEKRVTEQQHGLIRCKALTDLAELGIREPFLKSTRRPRRRFSAHDDKNLFVGFQKYGPVWHTIRDDTELGFGTRHPTDLRDRFRIRYPEEYAKAGYKLKPKEERMVEHRIHEHVRQGHQPFLESSRDALQSLSEGRKEGSLNVESGQLHGKGDLGSMTTSFPPTTSTLKSLGLVPYFPDILPTLLDDDAVSEDLEGTKNQITLNRNILQWADANPAPSLAIPPPPTSIHETPLNIFVTNDGIHINPLATLKLASATSYNNISPIANDQSCGFSSALQQQLKITSGRSNAPGDLSVSSNGTTEATDPKHSTSTVPSTKTPRTPNLPTIVFPYVPVASARTTLHNLPTPADLLLGMGLEKPEPQSLGIVLDDTLGLAMS